MKIVLIDDDVQVTTNFASIVQNEGHEILAVNDPSKAIYSIVSSKPDLVFIDFLMPTINGIDLLKRVRSIPGFSETNIYFMVHEEDEVYYDTTDTKGVQGYITKPLNAREILTVVLNKSSVQTTEFIAPEQITFSIDEGSVVQEQENSIFDAVIVHDTIVEEVIETPIASEAFNQVQNTAPNINAAIYDIVSEELLPKFEAMTTLLALLHQNLSSLPKSIIAESINRTLSSASTLNEYIKDLQVLSFENIHDEVTKTSFAEVKELLMKTLGTIVKIPSDFENDEVYVVIQSSIIEKVFTSLKKYFKDLSVDYTIDTSMMLDTTEIQLIFSFLPKNDIVVTLDSENTLLEKLQFIEQLAPRYVQLNTISTTLHIYLSL
jgi:CheY-like chemotaxis protein